MWPGFSLQFKFPTLKALSYLQSMTIASIVFVLLQVAFTPILLNSYKDLKQENIAFFSPFVSHPASFLVLLFFYFKLQTP
jgi:hypothetical protein